MSSSLHPYTIVDFVTWYNQKRLILSPDFQRGSVWTQTAKVYLIDTILNELPIPQVFYRTKINLEDQSVIREVVDGQQRLRAILEFAANKLRLTSKSPSYSGKYYKDLDETEQEKFLSYKIASVQLLNASDGDVLEVFARLNSYSVRVTPPELRHARYNEPVKWAIFNAAHDWMHLWKDHKIFSMREIVRLKHTSIMAEMFMMIDRGLDNGGEGEIDRYYRNRVSFDDDYFGNIRKLLDEILAELVEHTSHYFIDSTFYDAPNFLVLFAAVGFLDGKIPCSRITEEIEEYRDKRVDWIRASDGLLRIAQAFEVEENARSGFHDFVSATRSTTHRIASRKVRLHTLARELVRASDGHATA